MTRTCWTILGLFVLVSTAAHAHHGYANFYMDRTVTIEGRLEALEYANPHVVMKIRSADATAYVVTWQAQRWVEHNAGVTSTTFKIGDDLIVSAAPARDPAVHELASVREIRRPSDGWSWRRPAPFPTPVN
jgi:hypothetical protein